MKVAVFSTHPFDRRFFDAANEAAGGVHELTYLETRLDGRSAPLAAGHEAICAFVNDRLDRATLEILAGQGVRLVALRSAGFNHVDLAAAADLDISVGRVPAYSPDAIAEHTVAMILTLNRKIHKAYARVREGNFALDGLLGFDLRGRTVGIVGTGKIGLNVARIMRGFDCRVIAYDPFPDEAGLAAVGGRYVGWPELLEQSDIISLHCPLTPDTRHLVDAKAIARMKPEVMLINTSRGAVVDTRALIEGLKSGRIGYVGLDVYEEEEGLFFADLSDQPIQDDVFARLLTFPNVLITGHQAFFTREALAAIAETTIANISAFEATGAPLHPVSTQRAD
ncbi:hydroxyacid dehydrogenase [Sphingobium lactosutens]|uniref:2-hydroxyacid dehydrogenase n=1 Tax=Sphingobium lactosutens TaxID=522773 RepID=UPI0015BA5516|nr:2-hydroxyacid dehydrogenase [Sphingobium lactosutens]NWK96558.1 hydroxyacid dehydrogenase [Sphingobium lactosutens]